MNNRTAPPPPSEDGPSAAAFEKAACDVISRLPAEFREKLSQVRLAIEEFATATQLAALEMDDRWELTGLYEGVPLPEQSVWEPSRMPPVISLFRQPLLREMRQTGVGFEELVRHVVVHEAGHHFGFSDDDMHALEDTAGD
jgi:predicted Zn-dependent protease with MMP-like domain